MCVMCEKLVKCDKYHKANTVINQSVKFTDYAGEVWVGEEVVMAINHDEETLEPYAYIGGGAVHRECMPDASYGNNGFDIIYCPFCGEKLY